MLLNALCYYLKAGNRLTAWESHSVSNVYPWLRWIHQALEQNFTLSCVWKHLKESIITYKSIVSLNLTALLLVYQLLLVVLLQELSLEFNEFVSEVLHHVQPVFFLSNFQEFILMVNKYEQFLSFLYGIMAWSQLNIIISLTYSETYKSVQVAWIFLLTPEVHLITSRMKIG